MESAIFYSAIAGNQKVDSEAGIISGVSVITVGECAGKHSGTFVDQTTLKLILGLADSFKDGVKVKLSMNREHDGSVGQIVGSLKGFRLDGDNLRADLHLLKSDENFSKIVEMSSKMPEAFGLSVVVPNHYEKVNGRKTLRPTDIFSVDLVEEPAANKTGLFSAKPNEDMEKEIKYAKGNDGDHDKDCECKECMAKHSKKSMSEMLCDVLGLSATDTADTIKTKLAAFAPKPATVDLSAIETKLAKFETDAAAAALSAKKQEIAGYVSEATREGKVIPLTDDELLNMSIPTIKAMFSKLVSGQVKMTGKRSPAAPKDKDGKTVVFESADARVRFCQEKLAEGAAQLTAQFQADATLNLTRN